MFSVMRRSRSAGGSGTTSIVTTMTTRDRGDAGRCAQKHPRIALSFMRRASSWPASL